MSQSDERASEALLLQYINKITSSLKIDGEAGLKANFERNRINHILIFRGSFNPPHLGHLDFLTDSFAHAGRDLKLVCALIIPQDDRYLREHKFKDVEDPLVLPRELRTELWNSDQRIPSWAGVLRTGEGSSHARLQQLKEYARSLGLRVQFTLLHGAESCEDLTAESLGVIGPIDNILVNLYYRRDMDYSNSIFENLDRKPWEALFDAQDGFLRYQITLRTRTQANRGFLRLIQSVVAKNSTISSTAIRNLGASGRDESLALCELSDVVLSREMLQASEAWCQWCKLNTESLSKISN